MNLLVDIDRVLLKNKLQNFLARTIPFTEGNIQKTIFLKRIALFCFEIFEFILLRLGMEYTVNEKLIACLNELREKNEIASICILTDRSILGIKNIGKFIQHLKCDLIQVRKLGLRKNTMVTLSNRTFGSSNVPIYRTPYIKPNRKALTFLFWGKDTLVIDDNREFLKIAGEEGFKTFPPENLYIHPDQDEVFVYFLKKALVRA